MKKTPLFFLLFFLNLSLFAQKDSLQILEKQGDSLFLAGQNDQASRVYFRAFLKDILNRRLQDKFGLRNMEKHFSREEYRIVFVRDSTQEKHQQLFKKLTNEADSLVRIKELEKGLAIYQSLYKQRIDTIYTNQMIQEIRQAQVRFSKENDSLTYFRIAVVDSLTEEPVEREPRINHLAIENYSFTKIAPNIYRVGLPFGKYTITVPKMGWYEEGNANITLTHFFNKDSLITLNLQELPVCMNIDNVNFNTNDYRIEVIEKSKSSCQSAIYALTNFDRLALKFEGHCDSTEQQPTLLSLKRTVEVVKYLVNRGIVPHRLVFEYFGSDSPTVPNDSSNNRALNRRVELKPSWRKYEK